MKHQNIHAFVATPAYDGRVLTDYSISLADSVQTATLMGINVTACIMGNGAFIDLARNTFCRLFLESKATHLFFIDADLKWEARAFVGLLTSGKQVCAGAYPKRQDGEEYPIRLKPKADGGIDCRDGWLMCDLVATGFLCIERHVIETMWKEGQEYRLASEPGQVSRKLFYTYLNEDKDFVGEDYAWCQDYEKRFGEPIAVWPDFDFTHGGRHKGNLHQFLNRQAEGDIPGDAKRLIKAVA
jgi:hypothetical protein